MTTIHDEIGKFNIVQSDNGAEFTAEEVDTLVAQFGGKYIHSSVYRPQTNGVVERVNSMLFQNSTDFFRDTQEHNQWNFGCHE